MPNGGPKNDAKKLLNNSGLRARIAAVSCLCDTAEETAGNLTKSEILRLNRADRPAIKALDRFVEEYEKAFRDAGARLMAEVD